MGGIELLSFDVKLILRTMVFCNEPWNDLVCAVGSVHAAGPNLDQQSSECLHSDQGRSLDGVTQGHNASIRRGDMHIVRPPRSRPGQGCHREQARIGCPCLTGMRRLGRQRAPRPRVQQVRRNRYLRREMEQLWWVAQLPRVPGKLKDRKGKGVLDHLIKD